VSHSISQPFLANPSLNSSGSEIGLSWPSISDEEKMGNIFTLSFIQTLEWARRAFLLFDSSRMTNFPFTSFNNDPVTS
jgi:hypothetical protein